MNFKKETTCHRKPRPARKDILTRWRLRRSKPSAPFQTHDGDVLQDTCNSVVVRQPESLIQNLISLTTAMFRISITKVIFLTAALCVSQAAWAQDEKDPALEEYHIANAACNRKLYPVAIDRHEGFLTVIKLPFTLGKWQDTEPVALELKQGTNVLKFCRKNAPQYGIAVNALILKPVQ